MPVPQGNRSKHILPRRGTAGSPSVWLPTPMNSVC